MSVSSRKLQSNTSQNASDNTGWAWTGLNRNTRSSIGIGGTRYGRRILAVILVLCTLLLFQYGSHIMGNFDEETSNTNLPATHGGNRQEIDKVIIGDVDENIEEIEINDKYQLSLEHCKIPKLESRSAKYKIYEKEIAQPEHYTCGKEKQVALLGDNGIVSLSPHYDRSKCCIKAITRPLELLNDSYVLGADCLHFNEDNQFNARDNEFLRVSCENSTSAFSSAGVKPNSEDHSFHANVVPSKFQDKINYWKAQKVKPFNVLILVLDSVSKTDGHRNLPKTMNYLLNDLQFIEYNGYHVISEPTLKNAIPLLLGLEVAEFFKTKPWGEYWDKVPFIWKQFERIQYLTGYIEDVPSSGTFNYGGQKGFMKQPTDFYLRPLFVANAEIQRKNCVGQKSIEEFLLDYQFEILNKMNGLAPLFLMPWPCWPQHDYFGTLFRLDDPVFNLYNLIGNSKEILENTLMIIMGDHGFYTGSYANTDEGLLERRHPLFMMRLPKTLTTNNPEFLRNARANANKITSHYDVHKTLEHIVELLSSSLDMDDLEPQLHSNNSKNDVNIYGQSLLLPISTSRTCADAGIQKSRCACNLPLPSSANGNDNLGAPASLRFDKEPPYVQRNT